eukprot:g4250.t1
MSSAAEKVRSSSGAQSAPTHSGSDGAGPAAQTRLQTRPCDPMTAPVRKLSVNLIRTYKHINEVYYRKKKEAKLAAKQGVYNAGHDDANYDYIVKDEELLYNRYIVREKIGKGSFGQVVRAHDTKANCNVAIKIIKSKKPFQRQAKTEIELLQYLNSKDPHDQWFVVRLQETFMHHNHQCLVFEMLSYNLFDLLRNTRFKGVSLNLIRKFARQILKCLAFLALPDINIIHCDLKPENILLRDPKRSAIKVIDFGSSCRADNRMYTYIQSRFYRSPEVMMGLKYGVPIDMWSLGCILVEMHVGEPLFNGTNETDQMRRIMSMRGPPPEQMIAKANPKKRGMFFKEVDGVWVPKSVPKSASSSSSSSSGSSDTRTLSDIIGVNTGGPLGRRKGDAGHSPEHYRSFLDLVDRMLDYVPETRIKPIEALSHSFFRLDTEQKASGAKSAGVPSAGSASADSEDKEMAKAPSDSSNGGDHDASSRDGNSSASRDACTQTPVLQ